MKKVSFFVTAATRRSVLTGEGAATPSHLQLCGRNPSRYQHRVLGQPSKTSYRDTAGATHKDTGDHPQAAISA